LGAQEAELGERLRQSTIEQKGTLFSSQILIKDSRLGEVVHVCVKLNVLWLFLLAFSIGSYMLEISCYVLWDWELGWLILYTNPYYALYDENEGFRYWMVI